MACTILVGTSGWSYDDWAGRFYPRGLSRTNWLSHYAREFATVEVNNTFYRLVSPTAVKRWRTQVPDDFRFVVKGSRYITHMKRLHDTEAATRRFFEPLEPLGATLSVVLWQLPPTMPADAGLLDRFLDTLPTTVRHAVEFRHASWLCQEVRDVLEAHHAATVNVSGPQLPVDLHVTSGLAYVRFHGLAEGYAYDYDDTELQPWADHLARQPAGYAFFNNDVGGHAVENTRQLRGLLHS